MKWITRLNIMQRLDKNRPYKPFATVFLILRRVERLWSWMFKLDLYMCWHIPLIGNYLVSLKNLIFYLTKSIASFSVCVTLHNFLSILVLLKIHSTSMKTERLYFLFWSKNEVSHLCKDSAIFCPKHVGTTHNWKDLQIYTQFLLLQRLNHKVKKQKSRGHSQVW